MAKGDHKFKKRPEGSQWGGFVRPRVAIGFEPEQIERISRLAENGDRSFAATVRALVEIGLASIGADAKHTSHQREEPR